MFPTKLERPDPASLLIEWSDGSRVRYTVRQLRDNCPCATCREKRSKPPEPDNQLLPVLTPQEAKPLTIEGMQPMGNYAYTIAFSDGHNTGIFTFDHLLAIGAAS